MIVKYITCYIFEELQNMSEKTIKNKNIFP